MGEERLGGLIGAASPRAPAAMRFLRRLFGFVGRRLLGFRLELVGAENLPRDAEGRLTGGWIAAGLPHVTWIEPFVMLILLPPEPRLIWFGDGRAIYRSALRRLAFRRLGGVVPIWPGGGPEAFTGHVDAVRQVVAAGAVFALFPEVGVAAPVGTARPIAPGIGYFALRTGAPIVPIVFGGSHELFRGRRIQMRILPPLIALDLLGPVAEQTPPAPGTSAERKAARAIAAGLHTRTAADVAAAQQAAEPPPGARKRWRWLTHAFR